MQTLLVLAVVVQALTEALVRLGLEQYTVFVALINGVVVASIANVGLLEAMGLHPLFHWGDIFLAGVAIGGGAGLVQKLKEYVG